MPLSTEEADQLIAEITKKCDKEYCWDGFAIGIEDIEEIIKRFAGEPHFHSDTQDGAIELFPHRTAQQCFMSFKNYSDDEIFGTDLNVEQLMKLIGNCTKMLEYLKNDK